MRITYTTPFRLSFNLPKDTLLAHYSTWVSLFEQARKNTLPGTVLGNYGWGLLNRLHGTDESEEKRQKQMEDHHPERVHGEEGIEDPTWFFRDYYTLRFGETFPTEDFGLFPKDPALGDLFSQGTSCWWQCRIIDNTVAVLILNADIAIEAFIDYLKQHKSHGEKTHFIEFGNHWGEKVLRQQTAKLNQNCRWGREHLIVPFAKKKLLLVDQSKEFFIHDHSPIYPLPQNDSPEYHLLWSHCVYVVSPEEKETLAQVAEQFTRLFAQVNRPEVKIWLGLEQDTSHNLDNNVYGWGASTVLAEKKFGDQWLDALCISQYYYTCIDIADTALPLGIARQRTAAEGRKHYRVQNDTQNMKQALHILRNDYFDLMVRSNGEGYKALQQYYASWRLESLLNGLTSKLTLLEDLIASSTESINQDNQNKIQRILTFITILGIISLFAGMHDYLASGYNPRHPEWLPALALTASKVMVLATSVIIAFLAFFAYLLLTRRK